MNEKQYWIFTFGYGQKHQGHYVKIYGTYTEARIEMIKRYGNQFAFQYSEDEWNTFVNEAEQHAIELYGDKRFAMIEKELDDEG